MNILYIIHPSEQNTATFAHTTEIIKGLRKLGHIVTTTHISGSGTLTKETNNKPLWVRILRRTPARWLYNQLKGELALLYLTWIELKLLTLIFKPHCPDAIYSRHRWLNLFELCSPKPYIREINGFVADEMRVRKAGSRFSIWLFDRIEHWNLRHGDRWIPVCPEMAETLVQEYKVPREKITVVHNGVNTDIFKPDSNIPIQDNRICFAGQLWKHQNLDKLITAMPLIPNIELLLMGEGVEMPSLKRLATELRVQERVIFTGRVTQEKVVAGISSSTICVGPFFQGEYSDKIGRSGLKMYEYLSCGKPVVCSRSANSQPIEDESLGSLVDNLDPETIAEAISTLLHSKLKLEIGNRARAWAVKTGSWNRAAADIAKVMEEAIA